MLTLPSLDVGVVDTGKAAAISRRRQRRQAAATIEALSLLHPTNAAAFAAALRAVIARDELSARRRARATA